MTSAFRTGLYFRDDGGFPLTLDKPLVYDSKLLNRRITVPTGFETDLASIPRPLWAILPPIGKYDAAAVIHDYLYKHNGVKRKQADQVLREAMVVCKVGDGNRFLIYAGVRSGGWKPWNKYRDAEKQAQAA